MKELTWDAAGIGFKVPEKSRLLEGLRQAYVASYFDAKEFKDQQLAGHEIEALVFGHRLHGHDLDGGGLPHGAYVSADGSSVMAYGNWTIGNGSARLDGDQLCFGRSSTTNCANILLNPGATRVKENEYIMFLEGSAYPFSQVV